MVTLSTSRSHSEIISELSQNSSLKNTELDNDKKENEMDENGRRIGGEQKRK